MSRRRRQSAKAGNDSYGGTGALLGTIADANAVRLPDFDIYWYLFRKHPWVRACVTVIAEAISNEGFAVAKNDGTEAGPLSADDDARVKSVYDFLNVVFIGMTFRDAMIALGIDFLVFGVAFWRKKMAGSVLVGLERVDPRLVKPKFSNDRRAIESFSLRRDGNMDGIPVGGASVAAESVPADEIAMFKYPGGDVLLGAGSKLEGLDLTLAMDMNVRQHRNAFFKNGATTGAVLINKLAKEDQVRAAVKQVKDRAGSMRAYLPLILTGDWDVQSTAQTGKQEVDFVKGTGISREEVCAVYGVPLGKLVFSDKSLGSSGKSEDDNTFQLDCVLPTEEMLYETITNEVLRKSFTDMGDLELVPRRRNRLRLDRVEAALNLVKCGGTGNEARELIGLKPISDPKVDMDSPLFIGATGKGGVVADEPLAAAEPSAPAGDASAVPNAEVAQNSAKGKGWY